MIKIKSQTDRELVLGWLAKICETDPKQVAFVVEQCSKDLEARSYYVNYANGNLK